ncbi:PepSY domain-containing protein [Singulisphaera rosea]
MKVAILSLGLLVAAGVVARADDEETIAVKDLPKAVTDAVHAKFPKAKLTEASKEKEDGKTVYEVGLEDNGVKIDVAVSAKGKILEIEKTIAKDSLPPAVLAAIQAKYPKAQVKSAEEIAEFEEGEEGEGPETFYEVDLSIAGKPNVEVKLTPKGKIVEDEEDEEDDEDEKDEKDEKGKADKD